MDQKNNEQTMQLQLDIKPEVARGIYANLVLINHSHSDFVIDFAQALPGMPKPEVASRMIMAPEHAPAHGVARECAKVRADFRAD